MLGWARFDPAMRLEAYGFRASRLGRRAAVPATTQETSCQEVGAQKPNVSQMLVAANAREQKAAA